jgi:hypothetical protein
MGLCPGSDPVVGLKPRAESVVVHPQVAVAPAHDHLDRPSAPLVPGPPRKCCRCENLIAELASSSTFVYDRKRKGAAMGMGISLATSIRR